MENLDTIVTHLPKDQKRQFKALCAERASTISQTVRLLILNYLAENNVNPQ